MNPDSFIGRDMNARFARGLSANSKLCAKRRNAIMELTREQIAILDHTEHRAAGGLYCGGGKDMVVLVSLGFMEPAGRKSFVPEPYYRITTAGHDALRAYFARRLP